MLFSWLFQPLIRLVKRLHLKTSPPSLRVEGWHQGSTNAALGSKMGFQTCSLGVGLASLILTSCSMLEWYSILVWQCLTCRLHTHSVLSSRTDVMLVSSYIKLPCSVCGLSGEYAVKTFLCWPSFVDYTSFWCLEKSMSICWHPFKSYCFKAKHTSSSETPWQQCLLNTQINTLFFST